jgi:hypothetical protein
MDPLHEGVAPADADEVELELDVDVDAVLDTLAEVWAACWFAAVAPVTFFLCQLESNILWGHYSI